MRSHTTKFFLFSVFFFSCTLATLPFSASAAGLIPCGRNVDDSTTLANETDKCTLCHIVIGGNRIIEFGLNVMTVIAIVVIVAMAILYIISAGNDEMMKTAKGGIKAALIGFAVMLGAWLIVYTTLRVFSAQDKIPGLNPSATGFSFTCDTTR